MCRQLLTCSIEMGQENLLQTFFLLCLLWIFGVNNASNSLQNLPGNCNFETGWCGWLNVKSGDHFNWTRHRGCTRSPYTGPCNDHTTGGSSGFYIYIETSSPRKPGHVATLTSPTFSGPRVLNFFYHMRGRYIGRLSVFVVRNSKRIQLWTRSGQTPLNRWYGASICLEEAQDYKIFFEGQRGMSWSGDIALDDISFTGSESCNFDFGLCCWQNVFRGPSPIPWRLHRGSTASRGTGPSGDASTGKGQYIYTEASLPVKPGSTAIVKSLSMLGAKCLRFNYHMKGNNIGSLLIYTTCASGNETQQLLWAKSGNRGDKWFHAHVNMNMSCQYQIMITAITGSTWSSDIAVDNVEITPGACATIDEIVFSAQVNEGAGNYRVTTTIPNSGFSSQFSFIARQTKNFTTDKIYFIYPWKGCSTIRVSQTFVSANFRCIPNDFFFAPNTSESFESGLTKVLLVDRGKKFSQAVTLRVPSTCCTSRVEDTIYVKIKTRKTATATLR